MRNNKFVLPIICVMLIAILAVLVILPVNTHGVQIKKQPEKAYGGLGISFALRFR